jgi:glycosyltransferase EpsF
MLMNLYRALNRGEIQFDFAYFTNDHCDYDDEILALGGRIVRIEGGNAFSRFRNLWRVLSKGSWRTVHAHTLFSSGLHLLAAKLAKVPHRIVHSHSTNDVNKLGLAGCIYKGCMRWLFSRVSTEFVACGDTAARYLFPDQRKVHIIPNAIEIDRFLNAPDARCEATSGEVPLPLVILQVGRLEPVKNHSLSIRIAVELAKAGVNFEMLFVGAGSERSDIEAQIRERGLENRVRLLGLREDIAELMAAADVLLLPSLYEGFPVVLVEAQAAGLPAVISRTVPDEVDLGLGLVDFVDATSPPEIWGGRLLAAVRSEKVTSLARREALEARGFSAQAGAERLAAVYSAL